MPDKPTFEQLEDSLTKAEDELKKLRTLYNAAIAIGSSLSLEDTLKSVALHISNALNSAGCAISLWHQDRNQIETLVDYNRIYPDEVDKPGQIYDLKDYPSTLMF